MILSDNETKLDLLNNQAIAKTIVSIIEESKESVSIGVHGDWGAGKSSILVMVEDLLNPKRSEDDTDPEDSDEDDFDWDEWDEEDPEDAAEDETGLPVSGCITVRFNSWQYQGFEDAKIALMSAIVKALQKEAKSFYKEHPIKGAFKKIKETCKRIWGNLDKLSLAKNAAKIGVSVATGTAPLALLNIGAEQANKILTDETARNDFISKAGALLKPSSSETSSYKEMTDFRANYKELFKAAHIEKLVVLIDDLDRCLPKVAIETLEAVRMFLSMENTAFIIAADDAMIRYSVKEHFPRVLEQDVEDTSRSIDYNRFSDKYLEKLIQVPMHIPRLGKAEAQMYVLLLMIESQIGETEELKKLAEKAIKKQNKPWALEPITTQEIQIVLGDTYDSVTENVMIAKSIDKILAQNTGGNPRNIKRFVNMLLLRTMLAHNRGFDENDLAMPVLAKMMLAEQYNYDFYKAIAAELREDGTCPAFDAVPEPEDQEEASNEITESEGADKGKSKAKTSKEKTAPSEHKYKNDKLADKLKDEAIKTWVSIEPSLAGVDLRPYFFACTEQEDFFFSSQEESLRELIYAIRNGKFAAASKNDQFKALENADAKYIFNVVTQSSLGSNLSDQKVPKVIEGLRLFVKVRTELQDDLTDFLLTLPADRVGMWAVVGWEECIPKTSNAKPKLDEFIKKVQDQTKNSLMKSAAASALR